MDPCQQTASVCKISTDPLNMCTVKTLSVLLQEEPKTPNDGVQLLCASRLLCCRTACSPHSMRLQPSVSLLPLREQGNITPLPSWSRTCQFWTPRSLLGTTDTAPAANPLQHRAPSVWDPNPGHGRVRALPRQTRGSPPRTRPQERSVPRTLPLMLGTSTERRAPALGDAPVPTAS